MQNVFGQDLIGHEVILKLLSNWLAEPASSYIFFGPAHVGKRTVGERFIKLLLGLPCHDPNWKSHPDLVLFEAEEGSSAVTVEQVRTGRDRLSRRPMVAGRMVAYLPSIDRLNESGTNALLKVMEEPPAGAVFVSVAEDVSRIPSTVKSRSVCLGFEIVPHELMILGLERNGYTKVQAEILASAARGRPGFAIEQPADKCRGTTFVSRFINAKTSGERLFLIDELTKTCESADDPISSWRDELMRAMHEAGNFFVSHPRIILFLGIALTTAMRTVGTQISPRLALDICAINKVDDPLTICSIFPGHLPHALPMIYNRP